MFKSDTRWHAEASWYRPYNSDLTLVNKHMAGRGRRRFWSDLFRSVTPRWGR